MRLITLHIENFGKLHDETIRFEPGFNSMLKENGWGKSTTTAFIKAMLYGFDKKDRDERKFYAPWQGGVYGGYITLEQKGKVYRITRSFGERPALDVLEIRNEATNLPTDELGKNPGETVFGIGSEAFLRTVFIRQSESGNCEANDEMNARMGNITDGVDLNKFESADAALKNLENRLENRKNSESGRIKEAAAALHERIRQNSNAGTEVSLTEQQLAAESKELSRVEQKIGELEKTHAWSIRNEALIRERERYEHLVSEMLMKQEDMETAGAFFKKEVPAGETIDSWQRRLQNCETLGEKLKEEELTEGEALKLRELAACFFEDVPSEGAILEHIAAAEKISEHRRHSAPGLSQTEEERLHSYRLFYKNPADARTKISGLSTLWGKRSEMVSELPGLQEKLEAKEEKAARLALKEKITMIIAIFTAVILCGIGAAYYIVSQGGSLITSMILSGIGITAFLAAVLLRTLNKPRKREELEKTESLRKRIDEMKGEIDRIYEYAGNLLDGFGKQFDEYGMQAVLQEVYAEIMDFQALLDRAVDTAPAKEKETEELSAAIRIFLGKYGISSAEKDYVSRLNELLIKRRDYIYLKGKADRAFDYSEKRDALTASLTEEIESYVGKTEGPLSEAVSLAKERFEVFSTAFSLYEYALKQVRDFENEHDMRELEAAAKNGISIPDIEAKLSLLREQRNELSKKLENLKNALEAAQEKLSALNDDKDAYEEYRVQLEKRAKRYEEVVLTRKLLAQAKENLIAKYMGPLLASFSKYYGLLTGTSANTYRINAEVKLEYEEQGRDRQTDSLSSGCKDLVGFCSRLAMADAMFTGEKPMLVLDDPFVNLDDNNLCGAKKLLEKVSEEYQVLYFTCVKDRNVHFS